MTCFVKENFVNNLYIRVIVILYFLKLIIILTTTVKFIPEPKILIKVQKMIIKRAFSLFEIPYFYCVASNQQPFKVC